MMIMMMQYFYINTAKKEKTRNRKERSWRREGKRQSLKQALRHPRI